MLILRNLTRGSAHGHQIATAIEHTSDHVLQVDHGSLYPALHRLIKRGWITGSWGTSSHNRRAKFYRLTTSGCRQLERESARWDQLVEAIARVMRPSPATEQAISWPSWVVRIGSFPWHGCSYVVQERALGRRTLAWREASGTFIPPAKFRSVSSSRCRRSSAPRSASGGRRSRNVTRHQSHT